MKVLKQQEHRRCGRLGQHLPHTWKRVWINQNYTGALEVHRVKYRCDGWVIVEGGHRGVK